MIWIVAEWWQKAVGSVTFVPPYLHSLSPIDVWKMDTTSASIAGRGAASVKMYSFKLSSQEPQSRIKEIVGSFASIPHTVKIKSTGTNGTISMFFSPMRMMLTMMLIFVPKIVHSHRAHQFRLTRLNKMYGYGKGAHCEYTWILG